MSLQDHADGGLHPPVALGAAAPLTEAARLLLDRPADALGEIDLSSVVVVTPGRRAGRQLLVALDEAATAAGVRFVPPGTTTLPELDGGLGLPRPAVADPTTTLAAIESALRDAVDTSGVVATPTAEDARRWLPLDADPLELHTLSRRLHDADRSILAADRTWIEVADVARDLGGDDQRYLGVADVLADARRRLASVGLVTRDDAIADAIESLGHGLVTGLVSEVVLLGTVDPTPRDRRLLDAAVRAGVQVRPFVIAEAGDLDRFDRVGGVAIDVGDASPSKPVVPVVPVVPMTSIQIEARPMDAATALADWLGAQATASGEGVDPDEVAIVLADEAVGETVRRELQARGVAVHLGSGRSAVATGLARSLERLSAWFDAMDSTALGGLLADPVIGAAVEARRIVDPAHAEPDRATPDAWADWAAWASEQMPREIAPGWVGPDHERLADAVRRRRGRLLAAEDALRTLLGDETAAGSLSATVTELLGLLGRLDAAAADVSGDVSGWSDGALRVVRKVADAMLAIPPSLQPTLSRRDVVRRMLDSMRFETIPDPGDPNAVETIGWLDAPFDPASQVAIVGLHDAAVPGRAEDPWLPQSIRRALSIEDAERRLARDAWVFSTLLARDPGLRVIVPRRNAGGEELVPSRLLFGDRGLALARRVRRLFGAVEPRSTPTVARTSFARFQPAEASGGSVVSRPTMSVTEFRNYLQSPYRYWLRHILGLDVSVPVGVELDARFFGIVLHDAVEFFGHREIARLAEGRAPLVDPDVIHRELLEGLRASLDARTAGPPGSGLRLQHRIIERRLRRVAEVQAARTLDGWRVHAVEWTIDLDLDMHDGPPQRVKGRIDRIDRHDEHGWMLLDFKTSDSNKSPDAAHLRKDVWIDLQLPLYRWAASFADGAPDIDDIRSGYFLAGSGLEKIGVHPSKRIDPMFEEAIDTAREVVHSIRSGFFGLVGDAEPHADDPISLLMRTTALSADGEDDE